jgi:hypothetical protein
VFQAVVSVEWVTRFLSKVQIFSSGKALAEHNAITYNRTYKVVHEILTGKLHLDVAYLPVAFHEFRPLVCYKAELD